MSEVLELELTKKKAERNKGGRPFLWGTEQVLVPKPLVEGFKVIIEEYKKAYKKQQLP